jgi:hypothetical protein
LRQVLEPLDLHCPPDATWPDTPINVTRAEFGEAFAHLQQLGLAMKSDQEAAWKAFAQLRVQYECALMALVRLKKPPRGARWTTDRDETLQPLPLPIAGPQRVDRTPTSTSPSARTES